MRAVNEPFRAVALRCHLVGERTREPAREDPRPHPKTRHYL